jgi:hypothetical protein
MDWPMAVVIVFFILLAIGMALDTTVEDNRGSSDETRPRDERFGE